MFPKVEDIIMDDDVGFDLAIIGDDDLADADELFQVQKEDQVQVQRNLP